ncbi:MAG TPA: DUF3052 domain-containing protein [Acidimicrobiia bacterium]|nr:DUF3052 domain-containing protein [Acidimicrobiia bacterium]
MAGYSGTPLPQKLGIKAGAKVALVRAPSGFEKELQPLPDNVLLREQARGAQDVVLFFATRRAELERRFATLARSVSPAGGLWIAWPKRTACVATDLSENIVRDVGLEHGLVDNKVCAVDDTWSGLRFVYRLKDRPAAKKAKKKTAKPAKKSR